ncbi:MAG: hypothetical protein KatS3mg030_675 [Saprospiraceae bacterium]|nr:MAG: hypothetical protein KatS3mg030_675 [Saprospiraceae bacterium]
MLGQWQGHEHELFVQIRGTKAHDTDDGIGTSGVLPLVALADEHQGVVHAELEVLGKPLGHEHATGCPVEIAPLDNPIGKRGQGVFPFRVHTYDQHATGDLARTRQGKTFQARGDVRVLEGLGRDFLDGHGVFKCLVVPEAFFVHLYVAQVVAYHVVDHVVPGAFLE